MHIDPTTTAWDTPGDDIIAGCVSHHFVQSLNHICCYNTQSKEEPIENKGLSLIGGQVCMIDCVETFSFFVLQK